MDYSWRAKKNGDRMRNPLSQIHQADSTDSHKRRFTRVSKVCTGLSRERHYPVVRKPFWSKMNYVEGEEYKALALQVEAICAILATGVGQREMQDTTGAFQGVGTLLNVVYKGWNMTTRGRPFLYDVFNW